MGSQTRKHIDYGPAAHLKVDRSRRTARRERPADWGGAAGFRSPGEARTVAAAAAGLLVPRPAAALVQALGAATGSAVTLTAPLWVCFVLRIANEI